jgi:hypothetical protein
MLERTAADPTICGEGSTGRHESTTHTSRISSERATPCKGENPGPRDTCPQASFTCSFVTPHPIDTAKTDAVKALGAPRSAATPWLPVIVHRAAFNSHNNHLLCRRRLSVSVRYSRRQSVVGVLESRGSSESSFRHRLADVTRNENPNPARARCNPEGRCLDGCRRSTFLIAASVSKRNTTTVLMRLSPTHRAVVVSACGTVLYGEAHRSA